MPEQIAAILLAAGSSSRMEGVDKLWAEVGGVSVLARSLHIFATMRSVTALVVVAPAVRHAAVRAFTHSDSVQLSCIEGGVRRQDSVAAGLSAAPAADYYLIHDAARPLVTADLCERVLAAAREYGAAVPAVPVTDTIKRVDSAGNIIGTIDRTPLRAVQTPQAFAGALLRRAHAEIHGDVTDDASMVEALGAPIVTVQGDLTNFKVTTRRDLDVVRAILTINHMNLAGE